MTRTSVDARLRRAAAELHHHLDRVPIPDAPARAPARIGRVVAATVAAAAAAALLVLATPIEFVDGNRVVTTVPRIASTDTGGLPTEGPVFGEETGVMLLVDDGIDGLTAIDIDRRLAARSVVEGQRAGDEEYSMVRVGEHLVVGWGEPHSVEIATREAIPLGEATVFVPAAEPGRVWMVDTGMSIGSEPARVWQVDVADGEALTDPVPLPIEGNPQIGIPGGLAIQNDDGLALWDIDNGYTASLSDTAPAFAHDVHEDDLVWCAGECATLTITDTSDLSSQEHQPPGGYGYFVDSSISPDGRWVAALLGHRGEPEGRAIWILDRQTDTTRVVADSDTHVDYLAWSSDSTQLFATSWGYGQDHTNLWRYDLTDDQFAAVALPFGGTLTPVVVERQLTDAYIDDQMRPPDDCTAPIREPSGTTGICTFGY